jgi:oligopeptide/dipeptide ABC transporter ATP-binding protein
MYAGRIVEDMSTEQLLESPKHPYTRALIDAVPAVARDRSERLEFIPGNPPDLASRPTGCAYRDRCPLAMPVCAEKDPALEPLADGRRVACWAVEGTDELAEVAP